jgi:glycosyltransferase involved in cell wall biosynthesis
MPVYNGEKYLRAAISSVLNQSFGDFEFLIVNDGSTDKSVDIIQSYNDQRMRLIHNKTNVGVTRALNLGLELACGEYIARMDSDDISLVERLGKQVVFMDTHPDVGVCGTWAMTIGSSEEGLVNKPPSDNETIRCIMFFENTMCHSSVMIRKDLSNRLKIRYDPAFRHSQDYELWVRYSRHVRFANVAEVLIWYRRHDNSITKRAPEEQIATRKRVWIFQLAKLGIHPTNEEFAIHQDVAGWNFRVNDGEFLKQVDQWLQRIWSANKQMNRYPEPAFSKILGERWFAACCAATRLGARTWKMCYSSPLSTGFNLISIKNKLKLAIKFGPLSLENKSIRLEESRFYRKFSKLRFSNYLR